MGIRDNIFSMAVINGFDNRVFFLKSFLVNVLYGTLPWRLSIHSNASSTSEEMFSKLLTARLLTQFPFRTSFLLCARPHPFYRVLYHL